MHTPGNAKRTLRQRTEAECGPLPDETWERLCDVCGIPSDVEHLDPETDEDVWGTVKDFSGLLRSYKSAVAGGQSLTGRRRGRQPGAKKAPTNQGHRGAHAR